MNKEITIMLKMTFEETRRLANMCDHIGEEAHDRPFPEIYGNLGLTKSILFSAVIRRKPSMD